MSNIFEENKIEKNILVLHPRGYETEIARTLHNNLNNINVHWKNSINNIHFATYDAFMISLDFFEEENEPDWIKDIKVLAEKIIEKINRKLNDLLLEKEQECQRLKENNEYKKVLYTSGDELVNIVRKCYSIC